MMKKIAVISLILFSLPFFRLHISQAQEMQTDEIISRLFSDDKDVVDNAYILISRTKPGGLILQFEKILLSNESANRKNIIIRAMKYYPYENTVPACLEILKKSPSFLVKREIIDYLSKSHDKRIVLPIAGELTSPFSAVRESAILTLKAVGDDRMYPFMLRMLESENPIYRVYGLEALFYLYDMRFYDIVIKMLGDGNRSIRYYALKCIEKNRLRDSLAFVRRISQNDESWENRVKAIEILGALYDENSYYVLVNCVADSNREIRLSSAKSLNIMNFGNSAYSLSEQLAVENDDEIKKIIIDTLVKFNNAGGYKGLNAVLCNDKNSGMRTGAAFALGSIRFRNSVFYLLNGLKDPDPRVRAEVCNSLGYYSTKESTVALLDVINSDSDRYVRTAALYSIQRIGWKNLVLPLFDRYVVEDDPILQEKLRFAIRTFLR